MTRLKVFVYGTLKPGYENHNRYCRDRLQQTQPAQVKGELYSLSAGYPGMAKGQQWVHGYLLTLREDGQTLTDLDALEDYSPGDPNSLYQRELADIFTPDEQSLGQAWTYFMAIATIRSMDGIFIPSGHWR